VVELTEAVNLLATLELRSFHEGDPAALSALVEVELDQGGSVGGSDVERVLYLLSPTGGGLRLEESFGSIVVVTPGSPIGRALVGKRSGADVEFRTPQGLRQGVILSVE
jgi:hypothetical protein